MTRKTTRNNRWRKTLPALALGMAALIPVRQAQATLPVIDYAHIAQDFVDWLQNFMEWEQELQSWATQVSNIGASITGLGLNSSALQPLSDTDKVNLINASCPGPNLFSVSGLAQAITQVLSPDSNANITQSQQQICQHIVQLQIDKYDRTVIMLARINNYGNTLSQLQSTLNNASSSIHNIAAAAGGSGQSIADITSQMNNAQQNMTGLDAEMKAYQASISVDDAAISALQQMQSNLGKVALHGSPTPLGQLIQASAFAGALN
jgi:hypothetical protein